MTKSIEITLPITEKDINKFKFRYKDNWEKELLDEFKHEASNILAVELRKYFNHSVTFCGRTPIEVKATINI